MSVPLEQGYVGLVEVHSIKSSNEFSQRTTSSGLNLKATELRLDLPGSKSPERNAGGGGGVEDKNVYPLGMLKSLVFGAKRGFSDAIDGGYRKWLLFGNGGSKVGLCKDGGLFFPRGVIAAKAFARLNYTNQQVSIIKDKIPQSPKPLNEKKPHIYAPIAK